MKIEKQKVIDIVRKKQNFYIDLAKKDKSKKKEVDAILTATTLIICEIEKLGKNSFDSLLELEGIDKKADTIKEKQPEQETLEEAAEKYSENWEEITGLDYENVIPSEVNKLDFINGAKWQQERMYSEEEVRKAIDYGAELGFNGDIGNSFQWKNKQNKWFEQFKKK